MKKIVAIVGLAALGVSAVQTSLAQSVPPPDNSKPWSISATVRGFYDDNPATIPDSEWENRNKPPPPGSPANPYAGKDHKDSAGFEIAPGAALRWAMDQTTATLGVLYALKYYEHQPANSDKNYDQIFTFNAGLEHTFSEVQKISVNDSFVVGQEPDILRAGDATSTYQRISGSNIRNYGAIIYNATIAPRYGLELGYDNAYYDYVDDSPDGLAATLNRMENRAHVELLWEAQPETHALLGFQFRDTSYTGDAPIGGGLTSSDRDNRSYYVYIGIEHNFQQELSGSLRVGAQYSDYYNAPVGNTDHLSPYMRASLKWSYQPDSFVEAGFSYDRNATDQVSATTNSFVRDIQSAVVFGSINHHFTPKFLGSLIAQYQSSIFEGGSIDGQFEHYLTVGLLAEYQLLPNLNVHAGYNYDDLDSQIGRTFDRNRVFVGLTASY
jgi:hypothetical protein